jgi:hypothetical protein
VGYSDYSMSVAEQKYQFRRIKDKKYPLYLNGKWVSAETSIPVPINHGNKKTMESNPDQ